MEKVKTPDEFTEEMTSEDINKNTVFIWWYQERWCGPCGGGAGAWYWSSSKKKVRDFLLNGVLADCMRLINDLDNDLPESYEFDLAALKKTDLDAVTIARMESCVSPIIKGVGSFKEWSEAMYKACDLLSVRGACNTVYLGRSLEGVLKEMQRYDEDKYNAIAEMLVSGKLDE